MNYLLIFLGSVVLSVGIWLGRKYLKAHLNKAEMAERSEPDLYDAERYFDNPTNSTRTSDKPNPLFEPPLVDEIVEGLTGSTATELPVMDKVVSQQPTVAEPIDIPRAVDTQATEAEVVQVAADEKTIAPPPELIIVIYMVAQREAGFSGTDIFAVLEEVGLRYGKMKIFHHYGMGEIKVKQPIFSIANMVEPGIFDPQQANTFKTPGLAFFMRLPGPFGGRVAFELMLNNAQRITEVLKGLLQNEQHHPLDQKAINALREKIAEFEQRDD